MTFSARPLSIFVFLLLIPLAVSKPAFASSSATVKSNVVRAENSEAARDTLILPYAFSTDDLGFTAGLGGMITGLHQDQLSIGVTAFGGSESQGLAAGFWDYQLPFSDRWYLSGISMLGEYPLMRAYAEPSLTVNSEATRAGSHDSSFDNFIEAKGSSNWWELKLEYAFPMGATKDQSYVDYELRGGLLVDPPEPASWNPLKSGSTVLGLRQYNRYHRYETGEDRLEGAIHALELGLLHDNTDFAVNPSQGSSQYFAITHDAAWLESEQQWTFVEFEASKYFSLGATKHAKQRIVALNAWTGYSPTWNDYADENGDVQTENKPPFLEGATLGGFYRMRGYRQNRFHDKAAVYAAAEYRYTLRYNPLKDIDYLQFLNLDWFQAVLFVEGGRVAGSYSSDELFSDWKTDAGVSLRALTAGIVVRMDIANSEEGTNAWVMISHPF